MDSARVMCTILAAVLALSVPALGTTYTLNIHPKKTWNQARAACQAQGGDLATIMDASQNAAVKAVVPWWIGESTDNAPWIGLQDLYADDGYWHWHDGSFVCYQSAVGVCGAHPHTNAPAVYTNWKSGEPNEFPHPGGEDCAQMFANGAWNDERCDDHKTYICQFPAPTPSPTAPPKETVTFTVSLQSITNAMFTTAAQEQFKQVIASSLCDIEPSAVEILSHYRRVLAIETAVHIPQGSGSTGSSVASTLNNFVTSSSFLGQLQSQSEFSGVTGVALLNPATTDGSNGSTNATKRETPASSMGLMIGLLLAVIGTVALLAWIVVVVCKRFCCSRQKTQPETSLEEVDAMADTKLQPPPPPLYCDVVSQPGAVAPVEARFQAFVSPAYEESVNENPLVPVSLSAEIPMKSD